MCSRHHFHRKTILSKPIVGLCFFLPAYQLIMLYICTNIHDLISKRVFEMCRRHHFYYKKSKGHNSATIVVIVCFLHIVWRWFICVPSIMKISLTILKLQSGHDFHKKNIKRHNSENTKGGVTVVYSAYYLIETYICIRFQ